MQLMQLIYVNFSLVLILMWMSLCEGHLNLNAVLNPGLMQKHYADSL